MNKDLSKKILTEIKKKKINPKPRWTFLLKNYAIWAVCVISIIIGSISMAVIIYMIKNNGWEIYSQAGESFVDFILLTTPYFWVLFLGLFILTAYYNVRHTRGGYRHKLGTLVIVAVLISSGLGALFYNIGLGRAVDGVATKRIPVYNKIMKHRNKVWERVDKGIMSGVVVERAKDGFQVKDLAGKVWKISASTTPEIEVGKKVKLLGDKINKKRFKVRKMHLEKKPYLLRKLRKRRLKARALDERKISEMRIKKQRDASIPRVIPSGVEGTHNN